LNLSPNQLDFYKSKKIMVSGAGGYVGGQLINALSALEPSLLTPLSNVKDVHLVDTWDKLIDQEYDIIFHLIAQTSSHVANEHPESDFQVNVLPVRSIIEVCRKRNFVPTIIFPSTACVYGLADISGGPIKESVAPHPTTVYECHKLAAENYLRYFAQSGWCKSVSIRLPNVYGPGQLKDNDRGVLNKMIRKAVNGEDLAVFNPIANCVRDYIYISDVIIALLSAAHYIDNLNGGIYNIGTGVGHTISSAFNMVAQRVGLKTSKYVNVNEVPMDKEDFLLVELRNFIADIDLFKSLSNWEPVVGLTDGIDKTIDYFMEEQ